MSSVYKDNITKLLQKQIRRGVFRGVFLIRQRAQERRYNKSLIEFFNGQERRVLNMIKGKKSYRVKDIDIDLYSMWDGETNLLVDVSTPHITSSIKSGSELAANQINGNILYDNDVADILLKRTNRIKKISNNVYNQLKIEIHEGLSQGETLNQIGDRIRQHYDTTEASAMRIARTETSSAISEASLETYKNNGIEKKIWISSRDNRTRETHYANDLQGPIPVDQAFGGTGERFCGEREISCRCCIASYIGD